MGKLRNNEEGFGAVEAILVLVIVVIIGGVGWFVWHNHNKTTPISTTTNTPATTKQPPAQSLPQYVTYKRTTTVPANWATYSDTKYNFEISYPLNWQIDKPTSSDKPTKSLSSANYIVTFTPPGNNGFQNSLILTYTTLDEALSAQQKTVTGEKILGLKYYTIDGNKAARVDNELSSLHSVDFDIAAHGIVYDFQATGTDSKGTDPFSNKTLLTIFESLKIK